MSKLWLNKKEISKWAFKYCRNDEDKLEMRKLITDSYYAYLYCLKVKDRFEVRYYITHSIDAYFYCKHIKDRLEISAQITDGEYLNFYKILKERNYILITNK